MDSSIFAGKNILIIGGNAREPVDPFRFYANHCRPKTHGAQMAAALHKLGAYVTLVSPAPCIEKPEDVVVIDTAPGTGKKIHSAQDLLAVCSLLQKIERFDMVAQLAAVSSIKPAHAPSATKLQKQAASDAATMFEIQGNVDFMGGVQSLFPDVPIAGYNNAQQWVGAGEFSDRLQGMLRDNLVPPAVVETALMDSRRAVMSTSLKGRKIIVTAGATFEALYTDGSGITNFFSGRQGRAVAVSLAKRGAEVVLVCGPTFLADVEHPHITTLHVSSARQMYDAAMGALPADGYIGSGAVADFGAADIAECMLKTGETTRLALSENPNIVRDMAKHPTMRPDVVVSFAAQSPETIMQYALQKFEKLGVDMTVANPIGEATPAGIDPTMNQVHFITKQGVEASDPMPKVMIGETIADKVAVMLRVRGMRQGGDDIGTGFGGSLG